MIRSRFYLVDKRDNLRPWALEEAAAMWRAGKGTREIATRPGVDESEVWKRLDEIKRHARTEAVGAASGAGASEQPRLASGPNTGEAA